MHHHFSIYTAIFLFGAVGCSSDGGAPFPSSAPVNTNRKAYVGLFGDQAVAVLDTVTDQVLKKIQVTAPDGLIITPDGKKVYVSSMDTGSVKVITTADDALATSIDVGAKPAGLAVTPDGARLVVSVGGANEAVIVDTSSDTIVKHVPVAAAHAACISADGRYAYVGSQATDAPAVVELDITGDSPTRSMAVDKSPRMLSCTPSKIYFTAVGLDAVEVLDVETGKLETPITSGGSPHDVRTTADGKFEVVVSQTAGDLEFIDAATDAVVDKVPTGKLAHWITPFDEGTGAYVTNEGDNNVVAVDYASKRVTDTIPIGNGPRKMALQP
jgi:YVTN family beta-propeller protein